MTSKIQPFTPTIHQEWRDGDTVIKMHVESSETRFAWQLEVDGDLSPPYNYYQGILEHRGYVFFTAYWEGCVPTEQPVKIVQLKRVK